jgi:hypothetical protein
MADDQPDLLGLPDWVKSLGLPPEAVAAIDRYWKPARRPLYQTSMGFISSKHLLGTQTQPRSAALAQPVGQ